MPGLRRRPRRSPAARARQRLRFRVHGQDGVAEWDAVFDSGFHKPVVGHTADDIIMGRLAPNNAAGDDRRGIIACGIETPGRNGLCKSLRNLERTRDGHAIERDLRRIKHRLRARDQFFGDLPDSTALR